MQFFISMKLTGQYYRDHVNGCQVGTFLSDPPSRHRLPARWDLSGAALSSVAPPTHSSGICEAAPYIWQPRSKPGIRDLLVIRNVAKSPVEVNDAQIRRWIWENRFRLTQS